MSLYKKLKTLRDALAYDIGELDYESDADTVARHLLTLIDIVADQHKEDAPERFTGTCIQKYISNSGNTTWKVQDEDDTPVWLRQSHKDMLVSVGIWDTLNDLPMDEWYDDCEIVIEWVPDGDFKKPVNIISCVIPTLVPAISNKSDEFAKFIGVLKNEDYVILDTETTALDGEICEIAIIDQDGNTLLNQLVKPKSPITVGAQDVHGITNEMVADAPSWADIRQQVSAILKDRNVIIYNAGYDIPRMRQSDIASGCNKEEGWVNDYWLDLPKNIHCAMLAYAEYNGDWNDYHHNYRWVKLTDAADREGVTVKNAHRALGDCLMTLGVCQALANKY